MYNKCATNKDCRSTLGTEEAGNFLPLTRSSECHSTEQLYILLWPQFTFINAPYKITENLASTQSMCKYILLDFLEVIQLSSVRNLEKTENYVPLE